MVGEEADNSIFKDPQVILMGSQDGRPLIQRLNEILRHHTVSYPIIALLLRREARKGNRRGPIALFYSHLMIFLRLQLRSPDSS